MGDCILRLPSTKAQNALLNYPDEIGEASDETPHWKGWNVIEVWGGGRRSRLLLLLLRLRVT
jgi:hypothetical protein